MKFTSALIVSVAAMLASVASHAHFTGLEVAPDSPQTLRLRFSEEILEATPRDIQEKAATMRVSTPDGAAIAMTFGEEFMSAPVPGNAPSIIGTQDYGVLDRGEAGRGQFMLKYHARAARDAAAAAIASGLPVDVTAKVDGESMLVTVLLGGKPVADAELVVTLPQELAPAEAKTDAAGQARFSVKSGDWIAIRAMVAQTGSGQHEGKSYELVRHYSTLTFFHGTK